MYNHPRNLIELAERLGTETHTLINLADGKSTMADEEFYSYRTFSLMRNKQTTITESTYFQHILKEIGKYGDALLISTQEETALFVPVSIIKTYDKKDDATFSSSIFLGTEGKKALEKYKKECKKIRLVLIASPLLFNVIFSKEYSNGGELIKALETKLERLNVAASEEPVQLACSILEEKMHSPLYATLYDGKNLSFSTPPAYTLNLSAKYSVANIGIYQPSVPHHNWMIFHGYKTLVDAATASSLIEKSFKEPTFIPFLKALYQTNDVIPFYLGNRNIGINVDDARDLLDDALFGDTR